MAPRFIARQLSRPSGFIGVAIRHLMNRHNARMSAFAIQQLQLEPADHVLEIGFGGGVTLPALLNAAAFTAGVDRSSDVIDWAQRHFNKAIKAGRAEFREGNVESLPFERTTFDKTCTVNTVYFWTSLDAGFAEIHRVLKPRGRVVVGFLPKERMDRMGMPEDIFTTRAPRDVIEALTKAGFCDARVERPEPKTPWNVIVAAKAAPPN
ncbi:MAG: class I SAM-dependent methyltransferase [Pseudolabrys sp.]